MKKMTIIVMGVVLSFVIFSSLAFAQRHGGDTMAMDRAQAVIITGTAPVIMAVDPVQVVIITATARVIMAVGTAGGGTGTIPVVIGGALGSILTRVGGGPIRISIHIPMPIPLIYLHRRFPSSLPRIVSRSSSNLTTGTTARIPRATTHTSKVVRGAGCR